MTSIYYRGFHTKLTPELHAKIIEMAPKGLTLRVISKLCGLHHETLIEWLRRAKTETEKGLCTPFTELSVDFDEKIGNEIVLLIADVREGKKKWKASWELLKALSREDFGADATQFQYLVEIINKLKEDIAILKDNQFKGISHGGKVDTKSNQEAGSSAQGIGGQEGEEDPS